MTLEGSLVQSQSCPPFPLNGTPQGGCGSGFLTGPGPVGVETMKIRNSLKALMKRHRDNQMVRRRGRVYIINKTQKRYKARQG